MQLAMTGSLLKDVGGLRLTLITLAALCLPMVLFADMEPEGIGVLTAYIIPSVVVLFFFVLMLDALAVGAALLVVWGSYFRTLLEV